MSNGDAHDPSDPHIPVLLRPLLAQVAPVAGTWLDGTFGAGGYTRGLLDAGADRVIAVDRDPLAFELAGAWAPQFGERLVMQPGVFSDLDEYASDLDGIVLDLSRNRSKRFCSTTCGNRNAVAAYRARQAGEA